MNLCEGKTLICYLFFMPEARAGLSAVDDFFSTTPVEALSFDLAMDFHRKVFATSSEKLITPVDGLIYKLSQ